MKMYEERFYNIPYVKKIFSTIEYMIIANREIKQKEV